MGEVGFLFFFSFVSWFSNWTTELYKGKGSRMEKGEWSCNAPGGEPLLSLLLPWSSSLVMFLFSHVLPDDFTI